MILAVSSFCARCARQYAAALVVLLQQPACYTARSYVLQRLTDNMSKVVSRMSIGTPLVSEQGQGHVGLLSLRLSLLLSQPGALQRQGYYSILLLSLSIP